MALGVTVEAEKYLWRIDMLNKIPCKFRWLSAEPLLTPLPTLHRYLGGNQITLVHCGGESDRWHPRRPKAPKGGTWRDAFRVLLTHTINDQTLHQLRDTLPNTKLTLETWPWPWN